MELSSRKKKLSISDQLGYMENTLGIKFTIVNLESAEQFLQNRNYFFRIKAYAKNYEKYNETQQYVNLEFAYLKELSILDMHLRKIILNMTLDIEHYTKVQLMRDFDNNSKEDGYNIIQKLQEKAPNIFNELTKKSQSPYLSGLINHYHDDPALWNLLEMLSFGDFIILYKLYYEEYKSKYSVEDYLWSVRILRNATAHNNCLLNGLKNHASINFKPCNEVSIKVGDIQGLKHFKKGIMKIPIIANIISVIYAYDKIVQNPDSKKLTYNHLENEVINRFFDKENYFKKNEKIFHSFLLIKKVLDTLTGKK